MKRGVWLMSCCLGWGLVLGVLGCQRVEQDALATRQSVELRHYFSFAGKYAETMEGIGREFNLADSHYQLSAVALEHEAFKSRIRTDLQQGETADLYTYWAGARVQSIVDKLQPLETALTTDEMANLFGASIVRSACLYDGRLYFLPITQHFVGFFYNRKVFAELGLQPPASWNELLVVAKKLKAHGVTPFALGAKARWPAQFWFDYLLLRTAPMEYRQRLLAGKAAFTDPEVQRVFAMWHELIKAGMFNEKPGELEFDHGAGLMVRRGEAGMTLMGTWLVSYLNSSEAGWQEEEYGFFPFPEIDPQIPSVALGPIDGLVMSRDAKQAEGAKAVLRHFSSAGTQAMISRATGGIAPNLLVEDRHYTPLLRGIRSDIQRTHAWAFNYDLATSPARAEIGLQLFADFLASPDQYKPLLKRTEDGMAALSTQ